MQTAFKNWMVKQRQCGHSTSLSLIRIGVAIAKQQHFAQVRRRNWSDIDLIEDLRGLQSSFTEAYKKEKQTSEKQKWSHKKLNHEQLQQICQYLLKDCASYGGQLCPRTGERIQGAKRSEASVVWAYQVYVIVKFLTFQPVRQQETRQLKLEMTLFKELDDASNLVYVARNVKHKNQRHTGNLREYKIFDVLTQDLDRWLQVYRPLAEQSLVSLDAWLRFWGYHPKVLVVSQELIDG